MNESENYLDQLLNAVDGRSDLNDSDPVNPEEIESKEQMPQKSTRETIDIPDSNDLFMDQFEQELRKDNDPDEFLKQFEQELDRDESSQGVTKATQPMLDDIDQIMESVNQEAANDTCLLRFCVIWPSRRSILQHGPSRISFLPVFRPGCPG